MASPSTACVGKPFCLLSSASEFQISCTEIGPRDQYLWFSEFDFHHNGIERDVLFCHTCHRYRDVLIFGGEK